ncbi:MAG: hypothetical protein NVSMB47_01270 [Polyangiales bacterium]
MGRTGDVNAKIDLLRAAEAVFLERGLDKATIEEITARAGRSKGSFYLHFASKEDAFRALVETFLARLASLIEPMSDSLADPTLGPAEASAAWREKDLAVFDFLWSNRHVARLLVSGGSSVAFGYMIDSFAERARASTRRRLERGVVAGAYRDDLDPDFASLMVSGVYDRVARALVRLEHKPDFTRWVDEIHRFIDHGVVSAAAAADLDPPVSKPIQRPRAAARRRRNQA